MVTPQDRRRVWTNRAIYVAIYTAALIFRMMAADGRAGDCTPHQIDGQCGLPSFLGKVYGVVGAIALLLFAHLIMGLREREHRQQERAPSIPR